MRLRSFSSQPSAIAVCAFALTVSTAAQQLQYATHDWTVSVPGFGAFREAWADVKAPGNGRQYAVGTITVSNTFSSEHSSLKGMRLLLARPPSPFLQASRRS